jgi:hypothetical protein
MKPFATILIVGTLIGAFIVGMFYGRFNQSKLEPQHLTLEQILSIRELHLVKHTYNDLFFLHKQNDYAKPIRAIVQVPVILTAYLDLHEIQLIKQNDSITQIVLPSARLNDPLYKMDELIIRETRSFQIHVGADLYPAVGNYLQVAIKERMDTIRHLAVSNRILVQAEEEGKEYIIRLLQEIGRSDIQVVFQDEYEDGTINSKSRRLNNQTQALAAIPFGCLMIKNK